MDLSQTIVSSSMGASRKEIAVIEAWTRPSVIPIACSLMLMSSEFDDEDNEDEEEEEDDDDDEEPSSAISSDVSITIWMMEDVPHTRFKAVWRSRTVFQRRNDMVSQTVLSRRERWVSWREGSAYGYSEYKTRIGL